MQPGARIQAVIELLDQLESSPTPADITLRQYFKTRRYVGSKDRNAITGLFYAVVRHRASLGWWCERGGMMPSPRGRVIVAMHFFDHGDIAACFNGGVHSPSTLGEDELSFIDTLRPATALHHPDMPRWVRCDYPEWMDPYLARAFPENMEQELAALMEEAPTDLRVNTLNATREKVIAQLAAAGYSGKPTPHSPLGIRLEKRYPVTASSMFREGLFEVQDEGSQLVASLANAQPGNTVIDFCAGAGGKTLALAAQMQNRGTIHAWDNSEPRLRQLSPRLLRAGVTIVQPSIIPDTKNDTYFAPHVESADVVFVDAPCSGTGTWRRNPSIKWGFHKNTLDDVCAQQRSILQSAQSVVKIGGRLIYVTCSILKEENTAQIEWFLQAYPRFKVVSAQQSLQGYGITLEREFLKLTPFRNGTDGFFAAVLEKQ